MSPTSKPAQVRVDKVDVGGEPAGVAANCGIRARNDHAGGRQRSADPGSAFRFAPLAVARSHADPCSAALQTTSHRACDRETGKCGGPATTTPARRLAREAPAVIQA